VAIDGTHQTRRGPYVVLIAVVGIGTLQGFIITLMGGR